MKIEWKKEKCQEIALLYKTRREFCLKNWKAYDVSNKNGWLNDICLHMAIKHKQKNFWTKEKCLEVSLLCKTKKEFRKNYSVAYSISVKNKWLKDIYHLESKIKPMKNWEKEKCQEVALKCKTRFEFQKKYGSAYSSCFENDWLDDVCTHMKVCGNIYKRLIYQFEFEDNNIYIGLTCDSNRRMIEHSKKGPVYEHMLKTELIPKFKIITDFLKIEDAVKMENYYVNYYKNLKFNILNKAKTGSLGFDISKTLISKWNYNACKKESLKYTSRSTFSKNNQRAYKSSLKNKWIDEFYSAKRCKKIIINSSL